MPIEIQCSNFSDFDPASGKYVRCGEKASVSREMIGKFVNCKKCGQQIEVIAHSALPKTKPKSKSAKQPARTKANPKRRSEPVGGPQGDGELRMEAPLKREKSDVMSINFGEAQVESTLVQDQHDRCSKCGNISKSGKCTVCRHVEQSFKKRDQQIEDIKIELAGFQRWFCQTVNEGVSIKYLELGAHLGLGFIAVGTTVLSLLSICGLAFGVVSGLILLLITICASLIYISLIAKGRQFRRDPNAQLAWYQKPFWNGILLAARAMNWQNYDSNLKGRRITKIRNKTFGDAELANVEGLKNCQVLDLQDTSVTDASIQMLYGHKHLRCLVLKGTNTTHEAVFRLQQSHPRLWIWE